MSAQILELLFFAIIAFFVITKLISVLGTTNEDDPAKKGHSFFGENGAMKDVTNQQNQNNVVEVKFREMDRSSEEDLKEVIVLENKENIMKGLVEARSLLPTFNPVNFIKGAKAAFQMIMEADASDKELEELVDKRYLEAFKEHARNYSNKVSINNLKASILEIYTFGNNIFIKLLFFGEGIINSNENFHEEWTFTKNTLGQGPGWYLSNIERAQ
jgi:predicted lipid-binding transport protein (Tim44 family)